jgi:hypothetical protein
MNIQQQCLMLQGKGALMGLDSSEQGKRKKKCNFLC